MEAGGGGVGIFNRDNEDKLYASAGGSSSLGSLINATGGSGGSAVYNGDYDLVGNQSIPRNYLKFTRGSGGTPNGVTGGTSGFALSFTKSNGTYGAGGSGRC